MAVKTSTIILDSQVQIAFYIADKLKIYFKPITQSNIKTSCS